MRNFRYNFGKNRVYIILMQYEQDDLSYEIYLRNKIRNGFAFI